MLLTSVLTKWCPHEKLCTPLRRAEPWGLTLTSHQYYLRGFRHQFPQLPLSTIHDNRHIFSFVGFSAWDRQTEKWGSERWASWPVMAPAFPHWAVSSLSATIMSSQCPGTSHSQPSWGSTIFLINKKKTVLWGQDTFHEKVYWCLSASLSTFSVLNEKANYNIYYKYDIKYM